MKRILSALVLLMTLASCNRDNKQAATDLRFCGRWMTLNPNHEYFLLKSDGTYTDLRFTQVSTESKAPKAVSWLVKGDVLYLSYDYSKSLALPAKTPAQFAMGDTVKIITDSTLVLATPEVKQYPSRYITLIKMKENGKYTTD